MRQRFIDVHRSRAEVLKLEALLFPEGLTRQPRRHLARENGERLPIAQTIATQRWDLLTINLNKPALGSLNGRQPQTIHADPSKAAFCQAS